MKWRWALCMTMVMMGLLLLNGCGGGGDSAPEVSGVAAGGAAMANVQVSLKDSGTPVKELTTTSGADGSYLFNTKDLTPPFILKAVSGGKTYYSLSTGSGIANISPYTTMLLAVASGGTDLDALYAAPTKTALQTIASNLGSAFQSLQTKLQPFLSLFDGGNNNPITDKFTANAGLDAVLDVVSIELTGWSTIILRNSGTNEVFFSGPSNNFTGGVFDQSKMPKPPVTVAIVPSNASLGVNATITFSAIVTGSPTKTVTWSVVEAGGGTITNDGVYTAPATTGSYTVKAVSVVNPDINDTATVTVSLNPPPTAPTGATAIAGDGKATVSWTASAGATSYNLYYSTSTGVSKTSGTKISGVTSPKVVTALTNGVPYYFVVTALNANGESMESVQTSATPSTSASPGTFVTGSIYSMDFIGTSPDYSVVTFSASAAQVTDYTWNGSIWTTSTSTQPGTLYADGSVATVSPGYGVAGILWFTVKQDLAGRNISEITGKQMKNSASTFSSGAARLELHFRPSVDSYKLGYNNFGSLYTSLQELVDSAATFSVEVYTAPDNISFVNIKFLPNNIVNIYQQNSSTLLATGTWNDRVVQGETLRVVSIPDSFRNLYTWVDSDPYFVIQSNVMKIGKYRMAGREIIDLTTRIYNKIAFDQILLQIYY